MGTLKSLFVIPDERFQMILYASIIIRCLRISGPICGRLGGHCSSLWEENRPPIIRLYDCKTKEKTLDSSLDSK